MRQDECQISLPPSTSKSCRNRSKVWSFVVGRIFSSTRGGLEPHFRVLFSGIFQGASLGNFHQGRNLWKVAEAKVWSILVSPRTFFICVLIFSTYLLRSCENPSIRRF